MNNVIAATLNKKRVIARLEYTILSIKILPT